MVAGKNSRRSQWTTLAAKAEENLQAAQLLKENMHYNAACSRAYYAIFQMLIGHLFEIEKISTVDGDAGSSKHTFVKRYLRDEYGQSTIAACVKTLCSAREEADYENKSITLPRCEKYLSEAESNFRAMKMNLQNSTKEVLDGYR